MPSDVSSRPPLPGFGLRVDHYPEKDLFYCAFDLSIPPSLTNRDETPRFHPLTLREIEMLRFMNQITDKVEWQRKILDENITERWKNEIIQSPIDFTQEMADYCIEELKHKAEMFKKTGYLHVYNGDVIKSDCAIPADLQNALKAAIAPLEDVPEKQKDWHPGSDTQVLDLVHPSLFPLYYGKSRILTDSTVGLEDSISRCGEGEVIPEPTGKIEEEYSRRFQWLPCDVDVSGSKPRIVTYINNLHPTEHLDLYGIIEKVIEKVIPLWNATLSALSELNWQPRIYYRHVDYGALHEYAIEEGPKRHENENNYDFANRLDEWKEDYKAGFLVKPNPQPFSRRPEEKASNEVPKKVDLKRDYASTGLQIIVKLANIHLTPDKPSYNGGTWHIEGQLNEHICATAIYYYDIENIKPSHLAFRQATTTRYLERGVDYRQWDYEWIEPIFSMQHGEPAAQTVGSIQAREGRVVTFPNILQHQVQPFELADPSKPGHRKILVLFLVDPNIKIISTANVPSQRRDWWAKLVTSDSGHALGHLPVELQDKIIEEVDEFPISLETAKRHREELMEERKRHVLGPQKECFEDLVVSLCEH